MRRIGSTALAAIGALALASGALAGVADAASVSAVTHNGPQGDTVQAASVSAQAVTAISSAQIIANADQWYIASNNPPYNQAGYWQSRTDYWGDAQGDNPRPGGNPPAWREDCSGFLAHAWGEVDGGGGFTTYTVPNYSTPISWSQLLPGDALLFNATNVPGYGTVAHVGLFMGWDSSTTYSVMDESTPGSGSHVQNNIPLGDDGFWQYGQPIRYNGFVSSGTTGTGGASSPSQKGGYWLTGSDGAAYPFDAPFDGSMGGAPLNRPIVGMAATPDEGGYYQVASDGGVFTFGDARYSGSTGGTHLNQPIVGMAVDPASGGYWLVASDGGVFSFNAPFHGSTGNIRLNQPIVGMATTPDGGGYYLVASDGGVFTFGDARFAGSTGGMHLNRPIVGMAVDPATGGYWLVASDGGVFTFGGAPFLGSTGNIRLNRPIVGMAPDATDSGYWLVASDGGVFNFGQAPFAGSTGGVALSGAIIGVARGPS